MEMGLVSMETDNLAQAWQQIKKGDIKSYEWLFKRLASKLYSYGYRIVPNRAIVEDALQDLFVQLWEHRQELSDVRLVKPYLYKSIRSRLLRVANGNHLFSEEELYFISTAPYEESIIEQENDQQLNAHLYSCLGKLTPRQREIIHLKFYQQLEYEEIANVLNMVYQAAVNLCFRAISSLRQCLKNHIS
ncbi:MAG: sigma-70 family RNA polymerase sigma factor [Cytophagales bacterium]|nr:sigma-70 family RNA polymerase sigma factor [Bernardetiaceae bacterium]MDW8210678.1 sigma-70 family RNA polymerase sigma factor [Cytophagales bacterium]